MLFRWNEWNIEHIARHGIRPEEAEYVVRRAKRPYPRRLGGGKYVVRGPTAAGRCIQVIYVFDPEEARYVIHARPLTDRDRRRYRRGSQR